MHRTLLIALVFLTACTDTPQRANRAGGRSASDVAPGTAAGPSDLSILIDAIRVKHGVPGMVACVVTRDALTAIGAAGVREGGSDVAVTAEDRFHLGSCTKSMTATLCAILVEEGTLEWAKPLPEYLPGLAATMHDDYKTVTLEHLLTNHGGFPNQMFERGLWSELVFHDGSDVDARRRLVEGIVSHAPAAPVGSKFIYSNGGFSAAGHVAEVATTIPYEALMQQKLFAPLGIESAGFGAPGALTTIDQPRGHAEDGSVIKPGRMADNPIAISPAGRVHMSIGDWAKYIQLHLRGVAGDTKLLPKAAFDKLHTPYGQNYAYGWGVTERPWGGRVLTHNGTNTRWFAVTWLAPDKGFAVLVACNQGGPAAARACDAASGALIKHYTGG